MPSSHCNRSKIVQNAVFVLFSLGGIGTLAYAAAAGPALTMLNQSHWTTMAPEPVALTGSASAEIDGIIYVAGGADPSTNRYNTLQAFNPVTNTWTTLASMPQAVYGPVGGAINGKFYVAGGSLGNGGPDSNSLYVYDPPSDTWTQKANMLQPCSTGVSGVVNAELYVTCPNNNPVSFDVYNPAPDTWTALANAPAEGSNAADVVNGEFYMAGGDNGPGATWVYNPGTNTWSQLQNMLTWENEVSGAELDGRLYAFGGEPGACPVATVQYYDPILNKWKNTVSMPTATAYASVQVLYGIAFVIGGSNCSSGNSGATQAFFTTPSIP